MALNIKEMVDKAWENKSFKEISEASVSIIQGISEAGAEVLKKVLNVKTVRDLATNKYIEWAQSISKVSDVKDIVDKSFETKSAKEIADASISALQGISDTGFEQLAKVFHTKTIKELANNKFVEWAQQIYEASNKQIDLKNLKNMVDKAYETKPLQELVNASISALQGITDAGFEAVQKVLKVKTIGDLATNKYVQWAQSIAKAGDIKNMVDKAWETKTLKEIAEAQISIIQGISEAGFETMKKVLHVQTVKDLANAKFVKWAQEIVKEADKEQAKETKETKTTSTASKKK